jgi:DNA-damage-inducible protein D
MARDVQELLEYNEWRNFLNVIEKAQIACKNAGQTVTSHFVDVNKMVKIGSGAERKVPDIMLSRYACYLIEQNGDPRKECIAFASYFALQTRKQELSSTLYEHGVDGQGFAHIRQQRRSSPFWRQYDCPNEANTEESVPGFVGIFELPRNPSKRYT